MKDMKICFVSLSSSSLISQSSGNYIGGAEIQQVEIAKELLKRGYNISFITYSDNYFLGIKKIDNLSIYPVYPREGYNKRWLRKALTIYKKMKEIDADVYIHQAGSPGIVSIFSFLHKKKMIKIIASDADVTFKRIRFQNIIIDWLSKIADWIDIKLANVVIAQNNFQQIILENKFHIKSYIIQNAFKIPLLKKQKEKPKFLLWIGTIREVKQPHILLQLASSLPEYNFIMIGGEGESKELFRKIKMETDRIPNVKFLGYVPHDAVYEYYKKSLLLVNTSKMEGFPNIFIEAWMFAVPIVSLHVDPDGIITKYKLGRLSNNVNNMIKDIRELCATEKIRNEYGLNARNYVEANHEISDAIDKYEQILRNFDR